MREVYYAGAYWLARQESAEACAKRAEVFFRELARSDDLFSRWLVPGGSRKQAPRLIEPNVLTLQELLTQNRTLNDEGNIIEDLGFRLYADTGRRLSNQPTDHAYLNVLCGCFAEPVSNVCVLNLPSSGPHAEHVLSGPVLTQILRAMALAWEPDWAVATSHAHREQTADRAPAGTFVGGVMYFAQRRGLPPPLPEPVRVEPVEGLGTLVTLTPERFTVSNPDHVELAAHVRQVLAEAGLLVPVNPRGKSQ